MFALLYGEDGTGKTIQLVNMCAALENSIYLSLEVKDQPLLEASGINAVPVLRIFPEDLRENPFGTLDTLNHEIENILKSNYKNVFIDGVSQLRKFASVVVLKEENEERIRNKERPWLKIPEKAFGVWEEIGNRVNDPLTRLANWSHLNKRNVIVTARVKEDYVNGIKSGFIADLKYTQRYSFDVRAKLLRDGRGYTIKFEKVPNWAIDAPMEVVLRKNSLLAEFGVRGLLR